MIENFDCTQMISLDKSFVAKLTDNSFEEFKALGFSIVRDENIRIVKKNYFFTNENEYFIEFLNECFCGEFEDWHEINHPPKLISDFCKALSSFAFKNQIDSVKIYICFFAEKGCSSDHRLNSNFDDLLNALFLMSKCNYDIWVDNLILSISAS